MLLSDGKSIYMRHLALDRKGAVEPRTRPHLFCPTGLLDDSWWHRSYWIFGMSFYTGYRGFLTSILRRRLVTIIAVIIVFFLAMFGMGFVPNIFFPSSDTPRMIAELDLPLGTAIERTEVVVNDIERFIEEELWIREGNSEGFINWSTYIGSQPGPLYRLGYSSKGRHPGKEFFL